MLTEEDIKRVLMALQYSDENRDRSITLDDERGLTRIYLRNLQGLGAVVKDAKGIEILMIASVLFKNLGYENVAHDIQELRSKYLCHECSGFGSVFDSYRELVSCPKCGGNGITKLPNKP